VDFTCGTFQKNSFKKHLNALIGTSPDGKIVVRRQYLNDQSEVGFTVHLRMPKCDVMPKSISESIKSEIDTLLKKYAVNALTSEITNPAKDYIATDTAYVKLRPRNETNKISFVKLRTETNKHFKNQVDVVYKIPTTELDKLAGASAELESMSKVRGKSR